MRRNNENRLSDKVPAACCFLLCLLTAFYLLSRIGLSWCWLAFPIAEIVTAAVGTVLYRRETKGWKEA